MRNFRLAIAHRLLRTCEGRLGTTYSRRVFSVAKFIAPEPMRVGKDIL